MKIHEDFLKKVDLNLGFTAILAGLGLLVVGLKVSNFRLQQVSLTLFLAATTYLLCRHKFLEVKEFPLEVRKSKSEFLTLNIIFFFLLIISIFILRQNLYTRPLSFLVFTSIMAGIIAVEIFSACNHKHYYLIFFEIFILGVLLRASVFYQFPSMIGGDPWGHARWVEQLSVLGHVSDFMAGYKSFPIMHIFVASLFELTSLSIKDSMFFVGIWEVLSLIFIFLIVKQFFDEEIGLLSVLVLTLSNWHILWGFF